MRSYLNHFVKFVSYHPTLVYAHLCVGVLLLFSVQQTIRELFFISWMRFLTRNFALDLLGMLLVLVCLLPLVAALLRKPSLIFGSFASFLTSLVLSPLGGLVYFFIAINHRGDYGDVAVLAVPFTILFSVLLGICLTPILYSLLLLPWTLVMSRELRVQTNKVPFAIQIVSLLMLVGTMGLFIKEHPRLTHWTLSKMYQATWIDKAWDKNPVIYQAILQRLQSLASSKNYTQATGYEERNPGFLRSTSRANELLSRAAATKKLRSFVQPILLTAFRNEESPLNEPAVRILFAQRDPALRQELLEYGGRHGYTSGLFNTGPDDSYISDRDLEEARRTAENKQKKENGPSSNLRQEF